MHVAIYFKCWEKSNTYAGNAWSMHTNTTIDVINDWSKSSVIFTNYCKIEHTDCTYRVSGRLPTKIIRHLHRKRRHLKRAQSIREIMTPCRSLRLYYQKRWIDWRILSSIKSNVLPGRCKELNNVICLRHLRNRNTSIAICMIGLVLFGGVTLICDTRVTFPPCALFHPLVCSHTRTR